MEDVHAFSERRDVDHAVLMAGVHADLAVVRVRSALNEAQLEAGDPASVRRERPQVRARRPGSAYGA